jgi:Na+-translocating ferredoxin:NAD+ oxidoreductase RnfE subunit
MSVLFGHGPQRLARVAVRCLTIALAICIVPKLVAAGAAPLLQVLGLVLPLVLFWVWVRSRMHL